MKESEEEAKRKNKSMKRDCSSCGEESLIQILEDVCADVENMKWLVSHWLPTWV